MSKKKIIFVCTGNTCRSSMAEAMAKSILQNMDTGGVEVEITSAGTMALPGAPAAENAIKVLESRGIDLKGHTASLLTREEVQEADLVLTMTGTHREQVCALAPGCEHKVFTLAEYTEKGADISDPFGGPEDTYRQCAAEIEELVTEALKLFLSTEVDKPAD